MTQILVLFVALAGVVIRVCTRRMTAREWWIIFFVALNVFLVQLQMFVGEDGKMAWILRYHQAALTLLYGWAAWTVVELFNLSKGWARRGIVCAISLWLMGAGGTALWRIVKHEFTESKRNARMLSAEWAEAVIRKDWKGPIRDKECFFTVQEYHPSRRPIIQSVGAYLPNIVGGRWYWRAPDIRRHEKPDYAFLPKGVKVPPGMRLLAEKSFGKKKRVFCVYRAPKVVHDRRKSKENR